MRVEATGEVGKGSVVAVNARVGRGVSVGGSGVNVETRVGESGGASTAPAGWKGVGVGSALGFGVTSTKLCPEPFEEGAEDGSVHEERMMRESIMKARGCFIIKIGVLLQLEIASGCTLATLAPDLLSKSCVWCSAGVTSV